MKKQHKKNFIILTLIQVLILFFSFLFYHNISVLSYINISFYFAFFFLLLSLLIFTIQGGFFDVIGKSFNFAFSRGHAKRRFDEIPSLSEIVTIPYKPLLLYGIVTGGLMLIALFVYYS
ncbi:DUF3899 domain-containing protein [Neobacillus dielmonensis]|uniref:DUF3899 domain-containing protein n=1 Tax=Neobacillus dielmonensis TaxID=1347369 RepID=UPI0005A6702B|nr:DUF3899 domain-containing protein [Neobacillus dielmonensis]